MYCVDSNDLAKLSDDSNKYNIRYVSVLLQEHMLYFDPDSVVFRSGPNYEKPALGNYMDDFKHESGEGDTITEFASGGPKSYGYGYQTRQGKQECKVRGISLNSEGSKQLNFNVLKQNVKDDILLPLATGVSQTEVLKPYHIVRRAKDHSLETMPQTKKCQIMFSKRLIAPVTLKAVCNQQDLNNIDNLLAL